LIKFFELCTFVCWQHFRIDSLLGHEWFNEQFSELLIPLLSLFHTVKLVRQIVPHRKLLKVFDHYSNEQIEQNELADNQNDRKKYSRSNRFSCSRMILVNL
jgi:hypothetical protein